MTGGAQGLGLVMAQGLVESGAEVAILDINKDGAIEGVRKLFNKFVTEHPDEE